MEEKKEDKGGKDGGGDREEEEEERWRIDRKRKGEIKWRRNGEGVARGERMDEEEE